VKCVILKFKRANKINCITLKGKKSQWCWRCLLYIERKVSKFTFFYVSEHLRSESNDSKVKPFEEKKIHWCRNQLQTMTYNWDKQKLKCWKVFVRHASRHGTTFCCCDLLLLAQFHGRAKFFLQANAFHFKRVPVGRFYVHQLPLANTVLRVNQLTRSGCPPKHWPQALVHIRCSIRNRASTTGPRWYGTIWKILYENILVRR